MFPSTVHETQFGNLLYYIDIAVSTLHFLESPGSASNVCYQQPYTSRRLHQYWYEPRAAKVLLWSDPLKRSVVGSHQWRGVRAEHDHETWAVVEGLASGVIYEMRVVARDGNEAGSRTAASPVKKVRIGMKRGECQHQPRQ